MRHITLIAGARPNFMKIAPLIRAIQEAEERGKDIHYRLVHTGQHYDHQMSETFFEELNIPKPDVNLGCGGGTQAEQTAAIMVAFEKDLMEHPTDLVLVVGDVTSTMACSIVAKKLCTKVAHVEAGIRSWDLTMPEEINRMVTDSLADYFFTTSEVANSNLRRFGVEEKNLFRLLFMRDRTNDPNPIEESTFYDVLPLIMKATGLNREQASLFHFEIWAAVHGIAVMVASSYYNADMDLISGTLTDV